MPTYKDLFNALNTEFDKRSSGSALLLASKSYNGAALQFGLRVEVPNIKLEFIDHVKLGVDKATHLISIVMHHSLISATRYIDLKGDLFYKDLSEFSSFDNGGTQCYYQVHKIAVTGDLEAKNTVKIKFYADKGNESTVFAEFLARDIQNALKDWTPIDTERTGNWVYLNVGSASASLYKGSGDRYAVLKIDAIRKQTKIDLGDHEIISMGGDLTFKDIARLAGGTSVYISYTPDRIIFYPTRWQSNDYTAYFIRNDSSIKPLNITTSGNTEAIWEDCNN